MNKPLHFLHGLVLAAALSGVTLAERLPYAATKIEPPTPEWSAAVMAQAPAAPTVDAPRRRLLVFSLFTGYQHDVIPHVDRVFQILGDKSGAFETTVTVDIEMLAPEKLADYDVFVLNNNCSQGTRRNLLLDELERNARYASLTAAERTQKAEALQQSLLHFVSNGKGLVAIHGSPTLLNNSVQFTEMIGAAFDYHPPNQEIVVRPVDEEHPLTASFRGKGPLVHRDEPYCFRGAYEKMEFRPLLAMDVASLRDPAGRVGEIARYVAWVKPYGKGRVFYCSPSHFPDSYLSGTLLQFLLDGVQYAAGDLDCDDSPPS